MVTEAVAEMADSLEEHASNRADFRDLTDAQRNRIARQLVIARSQVNASNANWDDDAYKSQMIRKRVQYAYECGQAGLDPEESRTIWWNAVYDGIAPAERYDKV